MMKTNENAPAVATGRGASEKLSQVEYMSDYDMCQYTLEPTIREMVMAAKRIGLSNVKISADNFFRLFSFGSYDVDGSGRYSAIAGGVEFYCEAGKEFNHVEMQ